MSCKSTIETVGLLFFQSFCRCFTSSLAPEFEQISKSAYVFFLRSAPKLLGFIYDLIQIIDFLLIIGVFFTGIGDPR